KLSSRTCPDLPASLSMLRTARCTGPITKAETSARPTSMAAIRPFSSRDWIDRRVSVWIWALRCPNLRGLCNPDGKGIKWDRQSLGFGDQGDRWHGEDLENAPATGINRKSREKVRGFDHETLSLQFGGPGPVPWHGWTGHGPTNLQFHHAGCARR